MLLQLALPGRAGQPGLLRHCWQQLDSFRQWLECRAGLQHAGVELGAKLALVTGRD